MEALAIFSGLLLTVLLGVGVLYIIGPILSIPLLFFEGIKHRHGAYIH